MEGATYFEMLERQMTERPDSIAFWDARHPEGITYGELKERSGRVYAWLKQEGIGREKMVMVHLPRGAEAFIAAIGVLRAGAAYTILEEGYPKERVDFIEKDCGCALRIGEELYERMMAVDALEGWEPASEHDAAYAVYTSGTTGNPKGVLHERGQLTLFMHSIHYQGTPFCVPEDRFMLLSPLNFVASTLVALMTTGSGAELAIVDYDTVKNPALLRAFMEKHRITGGFMTPSLVRVFAGENGTAGGNHPFNPDFRVLFLSSEPARNIWYRNLTIYNVFGQSEMGFLGGVFRVDSPWEVTPIGQSPVSGMRLELREKAGELGEVCIANPYFRGYIGLKELTGYVMRDGIYHSGDIGRLLENGDMVLLGRSDDMVKINGNRVEPAEIEAVAKKALGVNWCAARAFVKPDHAYICVYYKDEAVFDEAEVTARMAERLPSYMVPSVFMKIDRIPMNANGKMNRKALPEPEFLLQEQKYVSPANEKEEQICRAFAEVLSLSRVGAEDDFYRIGGDSLKTIRLMSIPGMEGISTTDVFRERTARALAAMLERRKDEKPETGEILLRREREAREKAWPLSAFQQNFYDMQMRHPDSLMLALPVLYAFDRREKERLLAAAEKMTGNHPIFSSVLEKGTDGRIYQVYRPEVLPPLEIENGSEEDIKQIQRTLKDPDLPFAMLGHPLAKVRLIETDRSVYLYLLFHHVITDGTGIQAILNSLKAALRGEELPLDTYYSYLALENEKEGSSEWEEARRQMEALYAGTEWTGQIRSNGQAAGDENRVFGSFLPLTEEEILALEQECRLSRTGLYMVIMMLAIARHTGRRDILINWVFSNRGNARMDSISGMIIKSLALGLHFDSFETLRDVCRDVKEQMLANIACASYEWCLYHPPKAGDERLFFVYEGGITGFDTLREAGGELLPMRTQNQAVVHPMSAQVLDWVKDGKKGMLLAWYCNQNMFDGAETDRFRSIVGEMERMILKTPGSMDLAVKEVLSR